MQSRKICSTVCCWEPGVGGGGGQRRSERGSTRECLTRWCILFYFCFLQTQIRTGLEEVGGGAVAGPSADRAVAPPPRAVTLPSGAASSESADTMPMSPPRTIGAGPAAAKAVAIGGRGSVLAEASACCVRCGSPLATQHTAQFKRSAAGAARFHGSGSTVPRRLPPTICFCPWCGDLSCLRRQT